MSTFPTRELKVSMQKRDIIMKWLAAPPKKSKKSHKKTKSAPTVDVREQSEPVDAKNYAMPQSQKEKAEILFSLRIQSQKQLMKDHNVPQEFIDMDEIKRHLRLTQELKLKQKCRNLRISAEGNKTKMIDRIVHKLYSEAA